jgi:hypothetical protein
VPGEEEEPRTVRTALMLVAMLWPLEKIARYCHPLIEADTYGMARDVELAFLSEEYVCPPSCDTTQRTVGVGDAAAKAVNQAVPCAGTMMFLG